MLSHHKINTVASLIAAFAAVAALIFTIWQLGADERRTASFRNQCRSTVGAEIELINRIEKIDPFKDMNEISFLLRDWQVIQRRLSTLRDIAPSIAPDDVPLTSGLGDAADLASRWVDRTDFWNTQLYWAGNPEGRAKAVSEMVAISNRLIERDAGQIR